MRLQAAAYIGMVLGVVAMAMSSAAAQQVSGVPRLEADWVIAVGLDVPPDQRAIVSDVAVRSDGTQVAVVGDDHRLCVFDLEKREPRLRRTIHTDWARQAGFRADTPVLVTVGDDGNLCEWNIDEALSDPKLEPTRKSVARFPIRTAVVTPDGRTVAIGGFGSQVLVLDAQGNTKLSLDGPGGDIRTIATSPTGRYLAAAGRKGIVRLWQLSDGKLLGDYRPEGATRLRAITAIAFSPDGRHLAAGGDDGILRVWDITEGRIAMQTPWRDGGIRSIVFCDPSRIAEGRTAASEKHPIRVWDVQSGRLLTELVGHTGTVTTLKVNPRTGQLISGGYDTTVRGWPTNHDAVTRVNNAVGSY